MAIEKRLGLNGETIELLKRFKGLDECRFLNMSLAKGIWKTLVDCQFLYYEYMEAMLSESDYSSDNYEDKRHEQSDLNSLMPTRDTDGPGFYLYLDPREFLDLRIQQINNDLTGIINSIVGIKEKSKVGTNVSKKTRQVKQGKKEADFNGTKEKRRS